jgi:hypothetical protein
MMQRTFGSRRMSRPDGMLRPVYWPQMTMMDTPTGDGRLLVGDGGGVRELPRPFYAQFENEGHYGAKLAGSIDQVTFHEDGRVSGYGWILDDENGRNLIRYRQANALRHNSVDLADVEVEIEWGSDDPSDEEFWEYTIKFTKWNIGATTAVGMPAFKDASFDVLDDEELTAALTPSDELIKWDPCTSVFVQPDVEEVVASAATTVPWDDFNIPESDAPHKIIVDRDGRVFGHLCQWDTPHRGYDGVDKYAPRPLNAYREFNHNGPLTEKGHVGTGPIFFLNGHPQSVRGLTPEQIAQAYGGVENAWCDVRVTAGKFGPWVSGRVRPGLTDAQIYAARASHISGHWLGNDLVAIVSVNVPGYLPGAGYSAQYDDEGLELVAGFVPTRFAGNLEWTPAGEPASDDADEDLDLEFAFDN